MNKSLQVMKFGGTSVGDGACIRRAAEIVAAAAKDHSIVVVVSAMSGVTNQLVTAAHEAAKGNSEVAAKLAETLQQQHQEAAAHLVKDNERRAQLGDELSRIIDEAAGLCRGTALLSELTPRALDAISSIGERLSARLFSEALLDLSADAAVIEANELIITDDISGRAEPLMNETRARAQTLIWPMLSEEKIPVVTGFIAATTEGTLTTLGRGGSDYSATILGAALEASEIIIWTDVDGVLTADPRLVDEARTVQEISYNEAAELAYFGAKVLHPKTLRPVSEAGIPVWIRNSFALEQGGTQITSTGHPTARGVKAITAISDVSLVTVGGRGIVGVLGVAAKTFTAAANAKANVLLISQSSSENDICFVINSADATRTLKELRRSFEFDLAHQEVEHITVDSEIAVVAVVGDRMRGMPGIAGRIFSALGRREINIIAIAQGSSEYNISFVVEREAMRRAVKSLHDEFGLSQRGECIEIVDKSLV